MFCLGGKKLSIIRYFSLENLSKHDVDSSKNLIWKCNFTFLQSFVNYLKSSCLQNVLTILKLNWNLHFRSKNTKLNICHHMLTSSTQLQNRSFHVAERMRTSLKCPKMECMCKACKTIVFHCQVRKFVTFLLSIIIDSTWPFDCQVRTIINEK